MIKTIDIAWLGGLLEGEGYFGLNNGKYPIITLNMTDEDTVVKAAVMMGVKVNHYRNYWTTNACGARAIGWMIALYPFLGKRRKEKVAKVIRFWREYTYLRATRGKHFMATCHPDRLSVAYGSCQQCYDKRRVNKVRKKRLTVEQWRARAI